MKRFPLVALLVLLFVVPTLQAQTYYSTTNPSVVVLSQPSNAIPGFSPASTIYVYKYTFSARGDTVLFYMPPVSLIPFNRPPTVSTDTTCNFVVETGIASVDSLNIGYLWQSSDDTATLGWTTSASLGGDSTATSSNAYTKRVFTIGKGQFNGWYKMFNRLLVFGKSVGSIATIKNKVGNLLQVNVLKWQ